MKWLDNLRRARCKKRGHRWGWWREEVFEYPGKAYRSVADEVEYETKKCHRCGKEGGRGELHRDGFTKLTLPTDEFTRLKRTGCLIIRAYWARRSAG